MACRTFPELRTNLAESFKIVGQRDDYAVAAPQYRAAVKTAMGCKNASLRTELLRRSGYVATEAI